MVSYRIRVYGRVQGVGYRDFVRRRARTFGINGYVRNLVDGSVEIVAEGDERNFELFLREIKKGPILARVDRVEIEPRRSEGYENFEIRF